MSENEKTQEFETDTAAEAGDVEILEVVGVDDDVPAPSAATADEEGDDVVFTIDADFEPGSEPQAPEVNGPSAEEPEPESSEPESEILSRLRADYDNWSTTVNEYSMTEEQAVDMARGLLDDARIYLTAKFGVPL